MRENMDQNEEHPSLSRILLALIKKVFATTPLDSRGTHRQENMNILLFRQNSCVLGLRM